MEKRIFYVGPLSEAFGRKTDLAYWMSRKPDERLSAVDFLRRQFYGREMRVIRRVAAKSPRKNPPRH
jgi:hypothetical protein